MIHASAYIHPLANVESSAEIGARTKVWQFATVRGGAVIGDDCVIGQGAYVDEEVVVGSRCKLENYASVHRGANLGDEVFLGPGVVLTNDLWPRATTSAGDLKGPENWKCEGVIVGRRASVGARSVILPGVKLGENVMVGAGSVVTKDLDDWTVAVGSPARVVRYIEAADRQGL